MNRDNIVSVRLTDSERTALERLGRPSDVFRRLLRDALTPPAPPVVVLPITTAGIAPGYGVVWADGTCGPTWPAP